MTISKGFERAVPSNSSDSKPLLHQIGLSLSDVRRINRMIHHRAVGDQLTKASEMLVMQMSNDNSKEWQDLGVKPHVPSTTDTSGKTREVSAATRRRDIEAQKKKNNNEFPSAEVKSEWEACKNFPAHDKVSSLARAVYIAAHKNEHIKSEDDNTKLVEKLNRYIKGARGGNVDKQLLTELRQYTKKEQ